MPNGSGAEALTFEDVYRTYFRRVRGILSRLGVRESDLMDITQDVFIVVHRQLSGFEGRAKLTTWLFSICRRVASSYLRSASVRRELVVDFGTFPLRASETESQLDCVDKRKLSLLLAATLVKLPRTQRLVFVLFELERRPQHDIARLLEIPLGTVRSRLQRARRRVGDDMARSLQIPVRTMRSRLRMPTARTEDERNVATSKAREAPIVGP